MKIGIFGASGMLGHVLSKIFLLNGKDVTLLARRSLPGNMSKINYENFDAVSYDINSHNFDYVINCCGLIKQRKAVDSYFYDVNRDFPKKIAKKYGNRMIHISTDCVFSGKKGLYTENDQKDCDDVYGLSKSQGEEIEARIFRTSIIGTHSEDASGLLEWFRNCKTERVKGYTDHFWGGVTTLQLSQEILKELENVDGYKIKHVYSDRISKFEMLQFMKQVFEMKTEIDPCEAGKIDRSLSTILQDNFTNGSLLTQLEELKNFEKVKL